MTPRSSLSAQTPIPFSNAVEAFAVLNIGELVDVDAHTAVEVISKKRKSGMNGEITETGLTELIEIGDP